MQHFSDQQIIKELKSHFDRNQHVMREQHELLSQLEKINSRLVQSEKVQSAFLSNIRNEINNPLTSIIGLSRDMTTRPADRDHLVKCAHLIFAESFVMQFQLQNIFTAAESEAGEVQPYVICVDIKRLMESTVESFGHLIRRKQIQVLFDSPDLIFRTDSEKLKIILSNLLMNAVGHSPQEGKITIRIHKDEHDHLVVLFSDQGKGIPGNKLSTIFDRFVQLDTGTTKIHAGQRLGLSVVKSLTKFLGGEVVVASIAGKGSDFKITIPEMDEVEISRGLSTDGNEFVFDTDDTIRI